MIDKEVLKRFKNAQDSLVTQQSDFSLSAITQMVESKAIDTKPHYQRRDRWSPDKQSALIESFLLNVPVPPVYLSEDDYGTYSVIDGKQRITAICDFLTGNLALKNLKQFKDLNGLKFKDMPQAIQNALTVRPYIRVTTLLKQSNAQLKYEVFLRLNTGGEKLKPQEIRNVAYSGLLNDLLFELSENPFLKLKLKISNEKSPAFRNMDDLEHVLRFFTIGASWESMGSVLSTEMDRFMANHRNGDVAALKTIFNKSIKACEAIWGTKAFQKPQNGAWRAQLISPLYDAEMVAVSLLSNTKIQNLSTKRMQVVSATKKLFEDDEAFVKSISQSTNNPSAILKRVRTILEMLNKIAG